MIREKPQEMGENTYTDKFDLRLAFETLPVASSP